MKKLVLLSVFAGLILFGCSKEVGVTEPVQKSVKTFIKMPAHSAMSAETVVSVSQSIDGAVGGSVYLDQSVAGGPFGTITFNGQLDVPAGAYEGNQDIAITFDDQTASATYTPSPFNFNQPVILNLQLKGLDLTGIDPNTVDFMYMAPDGTMYKVNYQSCTADLATGTLTVTGAELPHFSRYGFVD